jgi:beta-glucosidase
MDRDFPELGIGMPLNLTKPHKVIDARDKASKPARFQAAVEGHVLVKNTNNALPLKAPKILGLYGYNAVASSVNMYYPGAIPTLSRWLLGFLSLDVPDELLSYVAYTGSGGMDKPNATGVLPNSARKGHLFHGGGSGSSTPSYITNPFGEVQQQAIEDDTQLYWDFTAQDPNVHSESDACLVFLNEFSTEAEDRPSLADPWSDKLVVNVAKKCKNTIVAINNAGIRLVHSWIDNPNATAVIYSHLPGQDSGKALVEILYGRQSPSGRLPYTVAKRAEDYGHMLHPEPFGVNAQSKQLEISTFLIK